MENSQTKKIIYDFDTIIPRQNTSSYKWDYIPGVIPLWVADMDFKAAPCILDAIQKKIDHGVFGYTRTPDSYYNSVIGWWGRRHSWTINKEWILPVEGLVPGTSICLTALTGPEDKAVRDIVIPETIGDMTVSGGEDGAESKGFGTVCPADGTIKLNLRCCKTIVFRNVRSLLVTILCRGARTRRLSLYFTKGPLTASEEMRREVSFLSGWQAAGKEQDDKEPNSCNDGGVLGALSSIGQ